MCIVFIVNHIFNCRYDRNLYLGPTADVEADEAAFSWIADSRNYPGERMNYT